MKAQDVCDLLNQLLAEQPEFTQNICSQRAVLSGDFAESSLPFVCAKNDEGNLHMGVIGLINGLIDDGLIAAVYDDNQLTDFVVIK